MSRHIAWTPVLEIDGKPGPTIPTIDQVGEQTVILPPGRVVLKGGPAVPFDFQLRVASTYVIDCGYGVSDHKIYCDRFSETIRSGDELPDEDGPVILHH